MKKLYHFISQKRELIDARYYYQYPIYGKNGKIFLQSLEAIGYSVHKNLPNDTDVDSAICKDIERISADKVVDTIIVVSGDHEYQHVLLDAITINNQEVEIYAFKNNLYERYKEMPGTKVITFDKFKILEQIINREETLKQHQKVLTQTGLVTPKTSLPIPPIIPIPEEVPVVIQQPIEKPKAAPKTARKRQPTRAEQLVGSIRYLMADETVREIHLVLKASHDLVNIDITKRKT